MVIPFSLGIFDIRDIRSFSFFGSGLDEGLNPKPVAIAENGEEPHAHADRLQADQRERWKFGAKKCYTALSVLHRVAPMPKTAENRA